MDNVMNDMAIGDAVTFDDDMFGKLTVLLKDGEPWFVAKEVAGMLGYSETNAMTKRLPGKEKENLPEHSVAKRVGELLGAKSGTESILKKGDNPDPLRDGGGIGSLNLNANSSIELTIINEQGLYRSIFGSQKKEALAFQDWVLGEVLPSIRKHGAYATKETLESWEADPGLRDAEFKRMKEEKELLEQERIAGRMREHDMQLKITRQELALKNTSWKAGKFDSSNNTKGLYTISNIASTIGTSAQHVNGFLRHYGFQYKQGQRWHLYDQYKGKGWTQDVKRLEFKGVTMCWTYAGREMIFDLWDMYQPVIKGRPWEAVKR